MLCLWLLTLALDVKGLRKRPYRTRGQDDGARPWSSIGGSGGPGTGLAYNRGSPRTAYVQTDSWGHGGKRARRELPGRRNYSGGGSPGREGGRVSSRTDAQVGSLGRPFRRLYTTVV